MTDDVKVKYGGVVISYNETTDRWTFELRGRERSAETLSLAKIAIDKPEPKEKKPFQRVKCYEGRYGGGDYDEVEVTSVAESSRYGGGDYFWTVNKGVRSKVIGYSLFPVNPHNTALIEQIKAKGIEIDELRKAQSALKDKLKPLKD